MTAMAIPLAGAPSTVLPDWKTIDWKKVVAHVRQLQMRIAKAFREGKPGKAKALQWILTHSFSAKLLAVNRVVKNKGGKTPGVDKIVWKTPQQKLKTIVFNLFFRTFSKMINIVYMIVKKTLLKKLDNF